MIANYEPSDRKYPWISVVIPTRHRNDLLSLCLERLAPGAQTLDPDQYEVIVTDDGSSDSAESLIARDFPWARWAAGPRRGPAANRNSGVKHAQGRWIVFTDDDCLPVRDWLSSFAQAIADAPDLQVFEGKTTCSAGPLRSPLEDAPVNLTGGWLWSCNFAITRQAYDQVGGFDEVYPIAFMEDADLRERLLRQSFSFRFVPDAIVDHPIKRYCLSTDVGRYAESEAIYWYRQGNVRPLRGSFLRSLVVSRVLSLRRGGLNCPAGDRVVAARLVFREIWHALTHLRAWELRYGPGGGTGSAA